MNPNDCGVPMTSWQQSRFHLSCEIFQHLQDGLPQTFVPINVLQRMNPNSFGDILTFHLVTFVVSLQSPPYNLYAEVQKNIKQISSICMHFVGNRVAIRKPFSALQYAPSLQTLHPHLLTAFFLGNLQLLLHFQLLSFPYFLLRDHPRAVPYILH